MFNNFLWNNCFCQYSGILMDFMDVSWTGCGATQPASLLQLHQQSPRILYSHDQRELGQSLRQVARPCQRKHMGPGPLLASVAAAPRTSPYLSYEVQIWALELFACQRWKKSRAVGENQLSRRLNYYVSKHLFKNLPSQTI